MAMIVYITIEHVHEHGEERRWRERKNGVATEVSGDE